MKNYTTGMIRYRGLACQFHTCENEMLLGNGCGVEVIRDAARLLRILEDRREKGAMEVKEEGKARPSGVTAGICCLRGLGKNS